MSYPHCSNRLANDPRNLVERMADLAAVDAHRARRWMFARLAMDTSKPDWAQSVAGELA